MYTFCVCHLSYTQGRGIVSQPPIKRLRTRQGAERLKPAFLRHNVASSTVWSHSVVKMKQIVLELWCTS